MDFRIIKEILKDKRFILSLAAIIGLTVIACTSCAISECAEVSAIVGAICGIAGYTIASKA